MKLPTSDEYEPWERGLRHVPTGIRVWLAFQNVEGGWTLDFYQGDSCDYDEAAVVQYAGRLLLE